MLSSPCLCHVDIEARKLEIFVVRGPKRHLVTELAVNCSAVDLVVHGDIEADL